jgi:hypothetical protein
MKRVVLQLDRFMRATSQGISHEHTKLILKGGCIGDQCHGPSIGAAVHLLCGGLGGHCKISQSLADSCFFAIISRFKDIHEASLGVRPNYIQRMSVYTTHRRMGVSRKLGADVCGQVADMSKYIMSHGRVFVLPWPWGPSRQPVSLRPITSSDQHLQRVKGNNLH